MIERIAGGESYYDLPSKSSTRLSARSGLLSVCQHLLISMPYSASRWPYWRRWPRLLHLPPAAPLGDEPGGERHRLVAIALSCANARLNRWFFGSARIMGGDALIAGPCSALHRWPAMGTGGDRVGARHSRTVSCPLCRCRSDGGMVRDWTEAAAWGWASSSSLGIGAAFGGHVAADTGERSARPGLAGPACDCWMARQRGSELEPPVPTAWYRRAGICTGIAGRAGGNPRQAPPAPALSRMRDCLHARWTHQQFLLGAVVAPAIFVGLAFLLRWCRRPCFERRGGADETSRAPARCAVPEDGSVVGCHHPACLRGGTGLRSRCGMRSTWATSRSVSNAASVSIWRSSPCNGPPSQAKAITPPRRLSTAFLACRPHHS